MKKILTYSFLFICFYTWSFGQEIELPEDFLDKTFHAERRQALRDMLPPNSVAVLFANPVRNRANDVDYVYHQDPNFYYLTGYKEPHATLLVFSDMQEDNEGNKFNEMIFVQPRDPFSEMWDGRRLGEKGVKDQLGFEQVHENTAFANLPIDYTQFDKVMFYGFENDVRDKKGDKGDLFDMIAHFKKEAGYTGNISPAQTQIYEMVLSSDLETRANVVRVIERASLYYPELNDDPIILKYKSAANNERSLSEVKKEIPVSNLDMASLDQIMTALRETKQAEELVLLKKAIEISCVGQIEVMKAINSNMSEMEIQGIHEFVYKKYGAEHEGYPSIVGSGHNGCILHYIENNRPKVKDELVLMDLGAEYHGYTADVTRTIPASGKFTPEQRAIYDLVYEAQEAAFKECKVGAAFNAPHSAAAEVISKGLVRLGIIKEGQSHNYFPHGTSHYLGLDVHDKGSYGPLQHNTVITVEPGIYIPHDSDCDPKWWGIAVRIEDDVLITNDGWVNMSVMAPRKADEIEALMAKPSPLDKFKLPKID